MIGSGLARSEESSFLTTDTARTNCLCFLNNFFEIDTVFNLGRLCVRSYHGQENLVTWMLGKGPAVQIDKIAELTDSGSGFQMCGSQDWQGECFTGPDAAC